MQLLLLKHWRAGAYVAVLVVLISHSFNQWQNLKTERAKYAAAETALQNPKVLTVVKTVTKMGPTRTIYRTIEKPGGEKETVIDETTSGFSEETTEGKKSEPVRLADLIPTAERKNRWLLTLGVNRLSEDLNGKGALIGYGWNNRFDLQCGTLTTTKETTGWVFGTVRF